MRANRVVICKNKYHMKQQRDQNGWSRGSEMQSNGNEIRRGRLGGGAHDLGPCTVKTFPLKGYHWQTWDQGVV